MHPTTWLGAIFITFNVWLRQSQGPSWQWSTSGDLTSAIVGKCPDWKGLSKRLVLSIPGWWLAEFPPELELELFCLPPPPDDEDVVAILLPLSLPLLLNPNAADDVLLWFKFNGFLKGLDGAGLMPGGRF